MKKPKDIHGDLQSTLTNRSSYRNFSQKPVNLAQLSEILYFSAGLTQTPNQKIESSRRPYPSAGAKYPLEIYPLVMVNSNTLKKGLYHYNVIEHSLEILLQPLASKDTNIWMSQKWFRKASIILIVTSVSERNTKKYGPRGIGYSLIEAGHLGQNVYLTAEKLGIGCSAIGELKEKKVIKLLDLNPDEEIPIYYLALGN
ncbi:MAG: SagB/ThcOx family dehydrogenase [Candidatus Curtissbacteria bacterium]